ncbi:MAG TPA: hypothetical protein VI341_11240 [Actinomycetota bacterium]
MRKNIVLLAVIASLGVGFVAMNAGAETVDRGGATLSQRVDDLEQRVDKQARAIAALRAADVRQDRTIDRLLEFRTSTNRWRAAINRLTSKLHGQGVYTGPVDNGQVQVGRKPEGCEGQVAKWNETAKSLGCVSP